MSRPQLTQTQQVICEQSLACLRAIETLSRTPEFMEFLERIRKRADQLADEVLHKEDLTPEEREKLRCHRNGIMEVLATPQDDRAASMRILAEYGIQPGEWDNDG